MISQKAEEENEDTEVSLGYVVGLRPFWAICLKNQRTTISITDKADETAQEKTRSPQSNSWDPHVRHTK